MSADTLANLTRSPLTWVVAVVALLLIWELAKKWVPSSIEWLAKRLAGALAGTRLMRRRSLRAYRDQVVARYALLPVPFRPAQKLDVSSVYVPLQTADEAGGQLHDAYDRIQATGQVVVLGRPGAGKSMLLRHSILTWAQEPRRRGGRIPVLLELRRCNGNTEPLEQLIVEQFERSDFPKADRFVRRSLREGSLSLLFDGLDEVGAAERGRVTQLLRDFAAEHQKCQIVVTCRTAIYNRNLAPEFSSIFHVAEFDERHIRRFLRKWPDIGGDAEVERLLAALRDTPRLMQLAGNPLLLTMIAYLYGGKKYQDRVLPHSRTEFYRDATEELLDRLKNENNRFAGRVKRAVLKQLALAAQDTPASTEDRRALRYETVLHEIDQMRQRINIAATDVDDLLGEIVDRSGLLLKIDGGDRYQFAHLTLQEYLAATALEDDLAGLLARYQQAPADWREVVKLWCGSGDRDSAPLIERIFDVDPVLAFECLAEAQVVDEQLALRIMDQFQRRISTSGSSESASVIAAFGMAAADPRPRGRRLYEFLVREATLVPRRTSQVLPALAATKLPEAARILSERAESDPVARESLITMGDLAVPALADSARRNQLDAVDMLGTVGTPAAAVALASLLRGRREAGGGIDLGLANRAAWRLAVLIADPDVELALGEISQPSFQDLPSMPWVWEPFREDCPPGLADIAGRIAYLMDTSGSKQVPDSVGRVDPRLAIPLCVLGAGRALQRMRFEAPDEIKKILIRIAGNRGDMPIRRLFASDVTEMGKISGERHVQPAESADHDHYLNEFSSAAARWLAGSDLARRYLSLFDSLNPWVRLALLLRLWGVSEGEEAGWGEDAVLVRQQDWAEVRSDEAPYTFVKSVPHYVALAVMCGLALAVISGGISLSIQDWQLGPSWIGWIVTAFSACYFFMSVGMSYIYPEYIYHAYSLVYMWPFMVRYLEWRRFSLGGSILAILYYFSSWPNGLLVVVVGIHYLDWWSLAGVVSAVVVIALLCVPGTRRERAARNPLRGLLELDELAARSRTSVISR